METTETTETVEQSFPIGGDPKVNEESYCEPCKRQFPSKGAKAIHDRWQHDEASRAIMLRGARKGAKARHRTPKLIGRVPYGSRLKQNPNRTCAFCTHEPFKTESGLRYHMGKEHGVHTIKENRLALENKFAKPPKDLKEVARQPKLPVAIMNGQVTRSEVVATIEVVRIGSEVYGRITSEISAR